MSNAGKNPSYKWLNLEPQSVDPTSPNEGDIFRSDGTPRDEGLWVYENAAWSQISTGATLSTLDYLTLTPQDAAAEAAPPLSTPSEGLTYRADGSGRAVGIWTYQGAGWAQVTGQRYQEFFSKDIITVRMASTVNIVNPTTAIFNGSPAIDGVVPATGNLVLLKNQTTASENGVYLVGVSSGTTIRDTSADTFEKLNNAVVWANLGTTNKNTRYYQTATLTSLSDGQVWGSAPNIPTFTVPAGVTELEILANGGGSGGGSGGVVRQSSNVGGGPGGGGSIPQIVTAKVTPGEVVTVNLGLGGLGGTYVSRSAVGLTYGLAGNAGGNTIVTGTDFVFKFAGGLAAPAPTTSTASVGTPYTTGEFGSSSAGGAGNQTVAGAGGDNMYAYNLISTGGTYITSGGVGTAGGGGGGGAGYNVAGGNGGNAVNSNVLGVANPGGVGKNGSGGGGGCGAISYTGGTVYSGNGGPGGDGYVRISWK